MGVGTGARTPSVLFCLCFKQATQREVLFENITKIMSRNVSTFDGPNKKTIINGHNLPQGKDRLVAEEALNFVRRREDYNLSASSVVTNT